MKWKGMVNGVVAQDFTYVTIEEQRKLTECLSELMTDFVSNKDYVHERETQRRQ